MELRWQREVLKGFSKCRRWWWSQQRETMKIREREMLAEWGPGEAGSDGVQCLGEGLALSALLCDKRKRRGWVPMQAGWCLGYEEVCSEKGEGLGSRGEEGRSLKSLGRFRKTALGT